MRDQNWRHATKIVLEERKAQHPARLESSTFWLWSVRSITELQPEHFWLKPNLSLSLKIPGSSKLNVTLGGKRCFVGDFSPPDLGIFLFCLRSLRMLMVLLPRMMRSLLIIDSSSCPSLSGAANCLFSSQHLKSNELVKSRSLMLRALFCPFWVYWACFAPGRTVM